MNTYELNRQRVSENMRLIYTVDTVQKAQKEKEVNLEGIAEDDETNEEVEKDDKIKKTSHKEVKKAWALFNLGILKSEYSKEHLEEMIKEHERLVNVMESPSKEDDKEELETQKEELKQYKAKLKKALIELDIIKGEKEPKNGDLKPSTNKGKKAMVYMGGSWHHFGDDNSPHNYSDEARESAKARHEKNLKGDDPRAKAFRVYWKQYWEKGGKVKKSDDDPCWDGYEQYGMKKKNRKQVPNCIKK